MYAFKRGQTSVILRVKLLDSSLTTGAGKTGLSSASSGLIISTIADNESSATAYTQAGSTIEAVTTNGTYAAPTATKCRFKEVDSTNHKGVYEIQLADARFAVSNAKSLLVSISGVTDLAQCDLLVQLLDFDPYDTVRGGLTALPNAAAGANGGLPLSVDASGRVDVLKVNGTSQTAGDLAAMITVVDDYVDTEVAAIKAKTDNLPASPAATSDCITAAGVRTAVGLATANLDTQLAKADLSSAIVEGSTTWRQSARLWNAALFGKASGLDTTNAKYRDIADTKNRIDATVDADGNRTAVTLDPS